MSTPAIVICPIKNSENEIEYFGSYVHYDGYLDSLGFNLIMFARKMKLSLPEAVSAIVKNSGYYSSFKFKTPLQHQDIVHKDPAFKVKDINKIYSEMDRHNRAQFAYVVENDSVVVYAKEYQHGYYANTIVGKLTPELIITHLDNVIDYYAVTSVDSSQTSIAFLEKKIEDLTA